MSDSYPSQTNSPCLSEEESSDTELYASGYMSDDCEISSSNERVSEFDNIRLKQKHDYASRFNEALSTKDVLTRYNKLAAVSHDFTTKALTIGKLIISELRLNSPEKTIQPVNIGGKAGGEKFLHQDILYKLVTDPIVGEDNKYLYGESIERLDLAAKAAGHSLRNGQLYHDAFTKWNQTICEHSKSTNQNEPYMHVAMEMIIDYLGFRLTAQPFLQLTDSPHPQYGSCDGGRSIHFDPYIHKAMAFCAKEIHLRDHKVYISI